VSDEPEPREEHNVVGFMGRAAERVPQRPALVFGGGDAGTPRRQWTFAELWRRAGHIAAGLAAAGLAPGERAIVMIPMSRELYAALLGLLWRGAVAVFVDPWMGPRQIASFAALAEPRAYLGVAKSHLLRCLDRRLRAVPITVTAGRRWGRWPARLTLEELAAAGGGAEVQAVTPTDSALVTFTSGSGGVPKGADRTHGFLAAQHRALAREFPYRDDDVDMPMFPVFALNNLALGKTSVVPQMDFRRVDIVDPALIVRQMETNGVTTATASPPFFDRLARHLEEHPRPLSLRRILTGGAPVADAQLRAWQRAFPRTEIQVVYGSTEAEPVAHIEAGERLAIGREGATGYCTGRLVPQLERRLVRIARGPLELGDGGWSACEQPRGSVGELVVSGEHVCRGYYRSPGALRDNKIIEPSGRVWHRMGDTGYFDGDGRFWLVGRVHSTIFRGGEPVHAQVVEQVARGDDRRVRRAAAVGLADPELGKRVVVVLESDAGEQLVAPAAARLRDAGQPADEIIVMSGELPLDPRHRSKIDYERLRRLLEQGRRRGRRS